MTEDYLLSTLLIGIGATIVMDLWTTARSALFKVPSLDYGLVGRWLLYAARGHVYHDPIGASPPLRGERPFGWLAHYLIGIAFAGLLLAVWGLDWARQPTLGPALIVGVGSVAAPFLVMQPGIGAGLAASRMPDPGAARLRSLVTHTVFGLGLYAAAWVFRVVGV